MQCSVTGCEREAAYKAACLCQKHYFRLRRNGTTATVRKIGRADRREWDDRGYQRIYDPTHPLADSIGYVAEHRKVVYDLLGGVLSGCSICGKHITWRSAHVDHIDRNPRNNNPDNLRPTCVTCNCQRDRKPPHQWKGNTAITFDGKTDTPHGWARDPRVMFCGNQIKRRVLGGMTPEQALMGEKATHKKYFRPK